MEELKICQEINTKYPILVEKILDKSSLESDSERQTVYGDLMDWVRDEYPSIPIYNRELIVKMLLGSYVIQHKFCLQKIYLVIQESNVDCEVLVNVIPCATKEAAKKVLREEKKTILREGHPYKDCSKDDLEIEEDENSCFINVLCDDYYEHISIVEKIIVIR